MEKITLSFSAQYVLSVLKHQDVILTLDENGKRFSVKNEDPFAVLNRALHGEPTDPVTLPKRVMKAFTASAIDKILAKNEIPNESGKRFEDGSWYKISITKGDVTKEYDADDASIETYPLLRYLASWSRKQ